MKTRITAGTIVAMLPGLVFAAGEMSQASEFIKNLLTFMNNVLVPALFALAFLVFLWGVYQMFILGGDNEERHEKGRQMILYAVIGFVIMISFWGIINLVASSIGLSGQSPNYPTLFKLQ